MLHRLAAENKFVFLGKGNKLYFVNLDEGGGPQEIFFEDEVWELKADSNEDVSGVQISGTSDQVGFHSQGKLLVMRQLAPIVLTRLNVTT